MRIRRHTLAWLIAANICFTASAADLDQSESSLYWRMEFGAAGQSPIPGYGFAFRHGHIGTERAAPALAQFDVSQAGAVTRLAGIPLNALAFQRDQTDDEAGHPEADSTTSTPWYGRQWVWWTGAGLALTAALASSGEDGEGNNRGNNNNGGEGVVCTDGECVVPCNSTGPVITCNDDNGFLPAASRPADYSDSMRSEERGRAARTGGMGDLFEH